MATNRFSILPSTVPLSEKRRTQVEENEKVLTALAARDDEIRRNLPNTVSDIQNRIRNEIDTYNKTTPVFGQDISGMQAASLKNLRTLKSEVEAFRNYIGDEMANGLISTLDQIKSGYDSKRYMSQFSSEDEYNTAVRQAGYRQKYDGITYDEAISQLEGLEKGSEEYNWLKKFSISNDVLTLSDYDRLISETENELLRIRNIYNDGNYLIHDSTSGGYAKELQSLGVQLENLKKGKWQLENASKYSTIGENEDYRQFSNAGAYGRDGKYNFINDIDDARAKHYLSVKGNGSSYDNLSLMTDEEIGTYNYLYNKEGKRSAEEYLDYLEYDLNARATQKSAEFTKGMSTENPVLMSALSVPANLIGGITGMADTVGQRVFGGLKEGFTGDYTPVDFNRSAMGFTQASNTTRSTVAQNLADEHGVFNLDEEKHPILSEILNGKSWGDAYQLGMSIADFGATALLAPIIGSNGATVLFGGSAGASTMLDAVSRGATDDQAIFLGILSGTAEATFEKFSLDNLLSGNTKGIINTILKQGFIEGTEEFNTTLANNIADMVIMAENSNYRQNIAAYMAQGFSEEEAEKKAFTDALVDIGWDFVGGALSGGIMGGGRYGISTVKQNANAKNVYSTDLSALIEEALDLNPDNALAQELKVKLESGKNASGSQIRSLVEQNESAIMAQDKANIQSRATERLVELGETGDVHAIANALAKQAAGEKLTRAESQSISKSTYGQRVASELNPENIRSGEYSSEWTGEIDTSRINPEEYSRLIKAAQIPQGNAETTVNDEATTRNSRIVGGQTAAENSSVAENVAVSKMEKTTDFEVSSEGETVLHDTGETVEIKTVKSVNGGQMMLELADGRTVSADVVDYATADDAVVYQAVASVATNAAEANKLIAGYSGSGISAKAYSNGIRLAHIYGRHNVSTKETFSLKSIAALPADIREAAYNAGQRASGRDITVKQATIKKKASESKRKADTTKESKATKGANNDKGGRKLSDFRSYAEKSGKKLSDIQNASVLTMEKLSAALGVDFYIFESYDNKDGKRVYVNESGQEVSAPNGYYSDGKIYIDLNAGSGGKGTMLFTVSHELTHFIKEWSPAKFKVLANFLMKQYGEKGVSVSELVDSQIAKAKRNGRELSWDDAYEEMVADSMETMLTDGNVVWTMSELKHQDKTLWQKICDWFKNLVDDLNAIVNAYKGYKPDSAEGQMVADMKDVIQTFEALYTEALVDAGDNYQAVGKVQKNTAQDGGVKYSLKEYSEHQKQNWAASKRIVVYSSKKQLEQFIRDSVDDKTMDKKMYFGAIPSNLAKTILSSTGVNVENYNLSLGSYEIRKILKDHGNENAESLRGQRAVVEDDFTHIVDIVLNPSKIELSKNRYMGKPAIVFAGNHNGRMNVVAVVSDKRLDLFVQTIYVNAKKGNLATPTGEQAPINTPEANSGTVSSENNILNPNEIVNKKFSDREYMIAVESGDMEVAQRMVDAAAKKAGYVTHAYHGTLTKGITEFKKEFIGSRFSYDEIGFFFTDNLKLALDYATSEFDSNHKGEVISAYIKTSNAFIFDKNYALENGYGNVFRDNDAVDVWDTYQTALLDEAEEHGADSIIIKDGQSVMVVAFEPNQIKSAEPVTYDSAGNVIPLSKRFKQTKRDIRYSDRDSASERANQILQRENAKLRDDVSYLKELLKLQKVVTGGTKFTKSSVEAAARLLMKNNGAKGNAAELASHLNTLYEYIARNEELTWEGVKEHAAPAVDWLQDNIKAKEYSDDYATAVLADLRTSRIYLNEQQKEEAAYLYESYGEFRKRTLGSIVISEKDSVSLDSKWVELSEKYPGTFDPNTTSADMPAALMGILEALRSSNSIGYGYDRTLAAQDILNQVYDSFWQVSTLRTVADVKQKEINELKIRHNKRMTALREYHKETVAQLKKEHREDVKRVKQEMRQKADKEHREIVERHIESRKKGIENRKRTAMRKKVRKVVRDLNKILNRGDKKRNVKEDMRGLAGEALRSAEILFIDNYSNEYMIRNGIGTELTPDEARYMDEARALLEDMNGADEDTERRLRGRLAYRMSKLSDVFVRERERLNKTKVSEVLGNLESAYSELQNSEYSYVSGAFDENVHQHLLTLKTEIGGTVVRDMSLSQLEMLYEAYTMVLTTVRNANRMFAQNISQTREELGNMAIDEVREAGGEHGLWLPGEDKLNSFSWNNLKPVYAFERIGSATLSQLYDNVRAGEDTWARDVTEAREYYLEKSRQYMYKSWDFKKLHKFTSGSGSEFELNLGQIMSLYAYSKREQAHDHLLKGGFVFDKNTKVQKTKMGVKLTYLKKNAKANNISFETLSEIVGKLTDEQKKFVDEMQDYLSSTMGEKGNSVSMQMYGVKLFKEKHYFPLRSASQYMARAKEADMKREQGQISIANSGFTKATTSKSSNPVVLSDFMEVWSDHVNEMSMYHSFVLPMEDFRRVYNYSSPNFEDDQSTSVNQVIQDAYGEAATAYIDQFYRDLNGGVVVDSRESWVKSLISKFKKASVFASASVVIQQPSAIGRAFALVDPKYFIGSKVDSKRHKALWAELKQYAPVAMIKEMGYFDTDTGKSAQDFITNQEYTDIKEKAKAVFVDSDYRDALLSKAPALADELTWCSIWEAVKRETKAKNPAMDVRSDEFLNASGKRFTEVVTKTQVYDSVLSRSGFMRSKGGLMSMMTAFMAEPTTSINMLEDALRKGRKGNKRYAAKAVGAVFTSVLLNSALVSLVYAARDGDDDETFWEKYLSSFTTEMLDGINPLTYYPFLKDVWSALQGFDIERADMTLITRLTSALTKVVQQFGKDTDSVSEEALAEHQKKSTEALWGVVDEIAALVGLPVRNVRRDVNGAKNLIKTIGEDLSGRDTSWGSLVDKTWDVAKNSIPVLGWLPDETKADKLYKATVDGDKAYVKRLNSTYKTETALNSAIRKGLRDNDPRIRVAAIAWNDGDMKEYMRIAKEIIGEKNFSQDNIVMAIRNEADSLVQIDDEGTSGASKSVGLFTVDNFVAVITKGDDATAKTIKADIIETAQANGKTADEAEKSFISSVKSQLGQQYKDGAMSRQQTVQMLEKYCDTESDDVESVVNEWSCVRETGIAYGDIKDAFMRDAISEQQAYDMYIRYGGYTEADAEEKVDVLAFVKENPECDGISIYAVSDYNEYCRSAGVSAETFYDAWQFNSNTHADVDENGESISGSKKVKVLGYIDSLDLTNEQKDSLYYAFGWAESRIYEAPWH